MTINSTTYFWRKYVFEKRRYYGWKILSIRTSLKIRSSWWHSGLWPLKRIKATSSLNSSSLFSSFSTSFPISMGASRAIFTSLLFEMIVFEVPSSTMYCSSLLAQCEKMKYFADTQILHEINLGASIFETLISWNCFHVKSVKQKNS